MRLTITRLYIIHTSYIDTLVKCNTYIVKHTANKFGLIRLQYSRNRNETVIVITIAEERNKKITRMNEVHL
jgi:hypothetical protein